MARLISVANILHESNQIIEFLRSFTAKGITTLKEGIMIE
jgi:hypothetical protein